jgi:DNA-binding Lrp family transcriptional regulator
MDAAGLDALDVTLIELMHQHPRVGILELSRMAEVARATVTARLSRMESAGVITGYGPPLDLIAAGYRVQALATLEITQGRLDEVLQLLTSTPGVLEAYATTGTADVFCHLAARSNDELQSLLLELNRADAVRRSTSMVILSVLVPRRTLPLLQHTMRATPPRAPSFRRSVPGSGEAAAGR